MAILERPIRAADGGVSIRHPASRRMRQKRYRRRAATAAIVVVAQDGPDGDVARMARSEMCRLVSAICTALGPHRIDANGECETCRSESCGLRDGIKRTHLPMRLP